MFWLLWSSSAMVVSLLSSSCAFICEASGPEGTLGADDGGMSLDRLLSRLELREDGLEAAPAPSMFLHTTTSSQSHFPPTANALCKWQCQKPKQNLHKLQMQSGQSSCGILLVTMPSQNPAGKQTKLNIKIWFRKKNKKTKNLSFQMP